MQWLIFILIVVVLIVLIVVATSGMRRGERARAIKPEMGASERQSSIPDIEERLDTEERQREDQHD